MKVKVLVTQSCLIPCDPWTVAHSVSSVHGIFQARILEWVAIPFPVDPPDPGIESTSALQTDSFFFPHLFLLVGG